MAPGSCHDHVDFDAAGQVSYQHSDTGMNGSLSCTDDLVEIVWLPGSAPDRIDFDASCETLRLRGTEFTK